MRALIPPLGLLALGLLALAGCTSPELPERRSAADGVADGLWGDPPDCVLVMPAEPAPALGISALALEEAFARHLGGRIDLVLGPGRRAALTRRLGLDLGHPGDRRRLAALTGCRHAALVAAWGGRAWAGVWAESRVGVDAAILELAGGRTLWRGRGHARRGDGGLPLSPLSAVVAGGLAARAALDREVVPSVLDDALRAALRRLPDFRDPQAFASRNSSVRPLSSRK